MTMAPGARVGTTFGSYEIRRLLGKGGMGEVYEAYDTAKGRVVALKILAEHLSNDENFRERFRRESHSAARLQEPHVIPIHDWGDVDGTLYIDMRLVNGVDLRTMLRGAPLDPARAVSINSQICSALSAAHADGLIHRDVKPENILVTPADFAYLVDFGIAESVGDHRLTMAGAPIGSFGYMAPERFSGVEVGPAADVYSLACVLHELLTGAAPFATNSIEQLIAAHTSSPPPRPSAVNAAVTEAFDEVISRGMAKDARDRYPGAAAFGAAAERALYEPRGTVPADPNATITRPAYSPAEPAKPYVGQPAPPQLPPHVPPLRTAPAPGPARGSRRWVLPVVAAAVVLIALVVGGVVLLGDRDGSPAAGPVADPEESSERSSPRPSTRTTTITTERPAPPPVPQVVNLPPGAEPCPTLSGPTGAFTRSARGTSVTSCPFSEEVRMAYAASGTPSSVPRDLEVVSPVTNEAVPMTCAANGPLVTCTGGKDAIVYVY